MKIKTIAIASGTALTMGVLFVACGGDSNSLSVTHGTVIQNATVVNTKDGSLQTGVSVVIDAGKIQTVTSDPLNLTVGTAQVVDGTGKYVVPGFLDMHTHASNTLATPPGDFPVLLANGVTGVREASGSAALLQTIKQQNAAVVAGTVDAPEVLLMPSSIFGGQSPTDAGARQFVRDRLAEGAGFIKITGGSPAAYLGAIDEAKKQGSTSAGHLTLSVSALDSSNAGFHSFEHLGAGTGLILDCSTDDVNIRAGLVANPIVLPNAINPRLYDGNAYAPFYQRIIDTYSDAKCQALAKTFAANDTWQTVTLIRLRTQDYGNDPVYRTDPNLQYVDKTRRALWESIASQYAAAIMPAALTTLHNYYALQLRVVKLMKQNGVKMLAASDLGGGLVIPGFSLHQEFHELAAAGLSPLEILQMTTLNGAQFVGRESTMGTVEAGRNADLVLLDANPIADSANLDKVAAVFLRGKYYPRTALDRLLGNVASAYAAGPLRALSTALDPTHLD